MKPRTPEPTGWHHVANIDEVASPALLVYPDRVEANIRKMLEIGGGPERLRPHVKTHKLPEIVRLQQSFGIQKFKCATIAEAEMVAQCGAREVLLALQPVGPNGRRLIELIRKFPSTRFATIGDDPANLRRLAEQARASGVTIEVLLDLDCGMHRTGIPPGSAALEVYQLIARFPGLSPGGLHAYDGHLHQADPTVRRNAVHAAMGPVHLLRQMLVEAECVVPRVVAGGSPTFPIHAADRSVECSPGTCLLWDAAYEAKLPDLEFHCAALVLTRVVSKPDGDRLCLDLGHKAIASENPHPRVRLLELPEAVPVMHSEEHLVIETPRAAEFAVGDVLYGVPQHVCPTVALHAQATVIRSGRADAQWTIVARDRTLTI